MHGAVEAARFRSVARRREAQRAEHGSDVLDAAAAPGEIVLHAEIGTAPDRLPGG